MSDATLNHLLNIVEIVIMGLLAYLQQQTHKQFNSRMDELTMANKAVARSQGYTEGEQAQRDRSNAGPTDRPV